MKEKREMNVEFENTMDAIVKTMDLARLSAELIIPRYLRLSSNCLGLVIQPVVIIIAWCLIPITWVMIKPQMIRCSFTRVMEFLTN